MSCLTDFSDVFLFATFWLTGLVWNSEAPSSVGLFGGLVVAQLTWEGEVWLLGELECSFTSSSTKDIRLGAIVRFTATTKIETSFVGGKDNKDLCETCSKVIRPSYPCIDVTMPS